MKPEVFAAERAAIAAFAPMAVISNEHGITVMDVPTRAADLSGSYMFRAIYDETPGGDLHEVRVYAVLPNFNEISRQLRFAGLTDEDINVLFKPDRFGNHMIENGSSNNGALAVAYANVYLSVVSRMLEQNTLHQLVEHRNDWMQFLPPFGMTSCGYRFNRPDPVPHANE